MPINLEIRRKTLECLGWHTEFRIEDGKYPYIYLLQGNGGYIKRIALNGATQEATEADIWKYSMVPLESDIGVCWPLFVEWMKENNCRAEIQTEGDGSAGLTIQSRDHDADLEGKTVADSFAPTLEMACCLAIIQASGKE